ncbi:MAG: hypothetical protein FWG47_07670, partial [Propionibacteriaceae bacterium]|nr:hypothetical protein [Propionibacteriaceae bacterium]
PSALTGHVANANPQPIVFSRIAGPGDVWQDDNVITNRPKVPGGPGCDAVPGTTIVITWPDGSTDEVIVGADGCWDVPIPPGTDGETKVVARDEDGHESDPEIIIVVPPLFFDGTEIYLETMMNEPIAVPVLDHVSGGAGRATLSIESYAGGPTNGVVEVVSNTAMAHGALPPGVTQISYRPNFDFVGEDRFQATVIDAANHRVTIPVRIRVIAPAVATGGEVVGSSIPPWAIGGLGAAGLAGLSIPLVIRHRRSKKES